MIFLSPAQIRKKRKLHQQSQRGTLTQEQCFQRAIEIDPFDSTALTGLGVACLKKGDIDEALRYFWRSLEADPTDCQTYLVLVGLYAESDPEVEYSLCHLAMRRALRNPRRQAETEKLLAGIAANMRRSSPGLDDDKLHRLALAFALHRPGEPERVAMFLLPYRLIQFVLDRPFEAMSRDWVDRILALGESCVPLLIGVVRGWARHDEWEDSSSATAALALLGEIGEQAAMPAIRECMDADEPAVRVAAAWAADRIQRIHSDTTVYDICCAPLPGDDEPNGRADGVEQDRRISRMLLDFMKDNVKLQEALPTFFGSASMTEFEDTDQMAFFDWLLNDYKPRHFRRTIPEEYLARHREQLTREDRNALREWTRSYSNLFEVQSVEKGVGVELKDLLLDRRLFVHDISSSNAMARWDCVFSRVRPEGQLMVFTAVGIRIRPDVCEELRDWISAGRKASGQEWLPYLRAHSHQIRKHCLEIYDQKRENMRFVTAEGDELVFSKAAYRVHNRERILEALESEELIGDRQDQDGTIRFTWFETAAMTEQGRRALGSLSLDGERLVLECTSRQRLKRGMALLHKLAGGALEEKLTEFQSPQAAMRNMPRPAPERAPLEGENEIIAEYKEQHFKTWPDISLPALGGRTPREAARDAKVRPRLIGLLKSIENGEEHQRMEGRAFFDVSRLKSELGVDY